MKRSDILDIQKVYDVCGSPEYFGKIPQFRRDASDEYRFAATLLALYCGVIGRYACPLYFIFSGKNETGDIIGIDTEYMNNPTSDGYYEPRVPSYRYNIETLWEYVQNGWIPARYSDWGALAQKMLASKDGEKYRV